MISETEKAEMLKDARNKKRRADFGRLKGNVVTKRPSLDSYLKFLSEFQKVFSFSKATKKSILAGLNRL